MVKHWNSSIKLTGAITLVCFLFGACKKDVIKDLPPTNTPVFTADGTLNGEAFSLHAGEGITLMQNYGVKVNGVDLFKGVLGNETQRLELGFFNSNVDLIDKDPSQFVGDTLYWAHKPTNPLAVLSKDSLTKNSSIQYIEWFIDGVFKTKNYLELYDPGIFEVCAHVYFKDGSQSTLCNDMILGYKKNSKFRLNSSVILNGNLTATIDVEEGTLEKVDWYKNGVFVGSNKKLEMLAQKERFVITAKVHFTNGSERQKSILVDGKYNEYFMEDFSYAEYYNNQDFWDLKGRLGFTQNQIEYRSYFEGSSGGSVVVKSVELFGENSEGKKVFKLAGTVNCQVKNMLSGEVVPLVFETNFGLTRD
jgi:hypothetical protein